MVCKQTLQTVFLKETQGFFCYVKILFAMGIVSLLIHLQLGCLALESTHFIR